MNSTLKYYLKLFIYFAIVFGLITLAGDYFRNDNMPLVSTLVTSVFFGITMAFFFTNMLKSNLEDHGIYNHEKEHLKLYHKKTIQTSKSLNEISERLLQSNYFRKFKAKISDKNIVLKSGISFYSFGEKILIEKIDKENDIPAYEISVQPIFKLTLSNFGRSYIHLKNIEKEIKVSV